MMPHQYTAEQLAFICHGYKLWSIAELTAAFNRVFGTDLTEKQIRACTRNRRFTSGRTGRFEKGHAPTNRGHIVTPAGFTAAQYKKGTKPHNTRPIGSIIKAQGGYWKVKVSDEPNQGDPMHNWRWAHRLLWEQHNGPIPDGHVVKFRDGNPDNLHIDNLMLLTKAENGVINKFGLNNLPPEHADTAVAIARLKRAVRRRALEATK